MPETDVAPGLWLVATPIGNLGDLSPRAGDVLRAADIVCCEDTRRTAPLLARIGATPRRTIVVNEHTEHDVCGLAPGWAGSVVALVSDAGTPGISDPGERLVRAALDAGLPVHAVPGPVAFVAAAVTSGFPVARLAFEGFLPRNGAERRERLTEVSRERRTVVLYEAPHRLARTLADLAVACGPDRRAVVSREITKMHEEHWRGTLAAAAGDDGPGADPRGEYVIVLAPAPRETGDADDAEIRRELDARLAAGISVKDAVDEVTAALGVRRNRVYTIAVSP
ncbi:MAG: hypothetical protein RL330_82 [Actinomycetota bacterium]